MPATPRRNGRRSTRSRPSRRPASATSSSRPRGRETIGYALLDSPVALAAWMLDHDTDSYYKIARAFVDGKPSGNLTRDHILDNITLYWLTGTGRLGGPVVLGGRTSRSRGRPDSSAGHDPGRLHHVPRRDLAHPAQLGRDGLPVAHLLQRGRQGRALRRLGRAGALRDRDAGRVQVASLRGDPDELGLNATAHRGRPRLRLRGAEPPGRVRRHVHAAGTSTSASCACTRLSAGQARRCCSSTAGRRPGTPGAC